MQPGSLEKAGTAVVITNAEAICVAKSSTSARIIFHATARSVVALFLVDVAWILQKIALIIAYAFVFRAVAVTFAWTATGIGLLNLT